MTSPLANPPADIPTMIRDNGRGLLLCGNWITPFDTYCDSKAAAIVVVGCVHEHLLKTGICQLCIDYLAHGRLDCTPCKDSTDRHSCPLTVIKLEDVD